METKVCARCGLEKELKEFHKVKSGRKGRHNWCKECARLGLSEYATKNRIEWKSWFESQYGKHPKCQICGRELSFQTGREGRNTVYFDHSNGGLESIKDSPSIWYARHVCNARNQKLWDECRFGILCCVCNHSLPTEGREWWMEKALQYIKRQGDNEPLEPEGSRSK